MITGERPFHFGPPPDYVLEAFEANNHRSPVPFPGGSVEYYEDRPRQTPEFWWRQFPNHNPSPAHQLAIGTQAGLPPLEAVRVTIAHLCILETVGIANPVIAYHFMDHPDPEQARLYTQTQHVSGLDHQDLLSARHRPKLDFWAQCLDAYIELVVATEQYKLWDTPSLKQYRWDDTSADPARRLYILDTDPLLEPATADLQAYREIFWQWYPAGNPDNPHRRP